MSGVAAVFLCLLFLPDGVETGSLAKAETASGQGDGSLLMAGTVVYQRSDGSYLTEVNSGRSENRELTAPIRAVPRMADW